MIEQNVRVVRCQEERLWIRMGSQSGCSVCDSGNGCGAGVFAKLLQRRAVTLELPRHDLNIEPGQMLTLNIPERVYIKLVLTSYGLPLLAALAGVFAGHGVGTWLGLGPLPVDACALVGALVSAGFAMHFMKRRKYAEAILGSLSMTTCYPSTTPNMCSRDSLGT